VSLTALTAETIYTRALRRAGELAGSDRWGEDELLEYVDDAQYCALCGVESPRYGWIEGLGIEGLDTLVSLVADQYEYPLDPEVKTITAVEYEQTTDLWVRVRHEPLEEEGQQNLGYSDTEPRAWYRRGNMICFMPIPESNQSNKVKVRYLGWEATIDAGTDSIFGNRAIYRPHQRILIPFVAARILESDGKDDMAATKMAEFERLLLAARKQINTNIQDSAAPVISRQFGSDEYTATQPEVRKVPWGS